MCFCYRNISPNLALIVGFQEATFTEIISCVDVFYYTKIIHGGIIAKVVLTVRAVPKERNQITRSPLLQLPFTNSTNIVRTQLSAILLIRVYVFCSEHSPLGQSPQLNWSLCTSKLLHFCRTRCTFGERNPPGPSAVFLEDTTRCTCPASTSRNP